MYCIASFFFFGKAPRLLLSHLPNFETIYEWAQLGFSPFHSLQPKYSLSLYTTHMNFYTKVSLQSLRNSCCLVRWDVHEDISMFPVITITYQEINSNTHSHTHTRFLIHLTISSHSPSPLPPKRVTNSSGWPFNQCFLTCYMVYFQCKYMKQSPTDNCT